MKLVYAVSQRLDPKRPAAWHLDNGEGLNELCLHPGIFRIMSLAHASPPAGTP